MDSSCCIRLNVGGKLFMTTADTLQSLPDTKLGRLVRDHTVIPQQDVELFFDRNPKIINSLLDLYRTGELHVPKSLCAKTVERELEFWEIPGELIRECCFRGFQEHREDAATTAEIDQFLMFPYDTPGDFRKLSALGKIWLMMERPRLCLASKIWGIFFFTVVNFSVLLYCLESIMSFRTIHPMFQRGLVEKNLSWELAVSNMTMDKFLVTISDPWIVHASNMVFFFFLLEFLVRFLTCPRKGFFVRQARNRLDMFLLLHNGAVFLLDLFVVNGNLYIPKAVVDFVTFFYAFSALKIAEDSVHHQRLRCYEDPEQVSSDEANICPVTTATPRTCWKGCPGDLMYVSVGPAGMWGVARPYLIHYRTGTYLGLHSLGTSWVGIVQVDVGTDIMWGVNMFGELYYRAGIASSDPNGSHWVSKGRGFRWISISPGNSVWAINTADQVIRYHDSAWEVVGMKRVDAGQAGVWALNTTGHLFHRLGTYGDGGSAGTEWRARFSRCRLAEAWWWLGT